jgi:predicted RNase H-like HicB family nuclease
VRKIIIHRSEADEETPYWAECPSLGIASIGESVEDAIRMIQEAIGLHIEDLTEHGEIVPPEDVQLIPVEQALVLDV